MRLLKRAVHYYVKIISSRRCMSSGCGRAVMSFGDGSHGALGLPTSLTGIGGDAYEPTRVPGLPSDVTSVSAGHYHSLAVTSSGAVWAWGRNNEAQLGRDVLEPRDTWNNPKRVEGLSQVNVTAAFASGVVSSAIGDDGSLWVWGKSKRGQLGLGKDITEALVPARVSALTGENIVKVSFGWGHALAQTKDGKLFGWGYSADGRIGDLGKTLARSPLDSNMNVCESNQEISISTIEEAEKLVLEGMEKEKDMPIIWEPCLVEELDGVEVIDIACGFDHSLVLGCNAVLLSCGSNVYGQLGREKQDMGMFPVDINFLPMSISSGLGHSLAIFQAPSSDVTGGAGSVVSWGWNRSFQLGRTGTDNVPLVVQGLEGESVGSVSGGRAHSMALTSKGEVWTWGCGKNGRLGLGSSGDEAEPMWIDCLEVRDSIKSGPGSSKESCVGSTKNNSLLKSRLIEGVRGRLIYDKSSLSTVSEPRQERNLIIERCWKTLLKLPHQQQQIPPLSSSATLLPIKGIGLRIGENPEIGLIGLAIFMGMREKRLSLAL